MNFATELTLDEFELEAQRIDVATRLLKGFRGIDALDFANVVMTEALERYIAALRPSPIEHALAVRLTAGPDRRGLAVAQRRGHWQIRFGADGHSEWHRIEACEIIPHSELAGPKQDLLMSPAD